MANIKIFLRDGRVKDFPHVGRPGGSYTKSIKYEGNFVVVTDEYGNTEGYPMDLVERVETRPNRY